MGKVFAVLALLVMVGCADVGPDGAESDVDSANGKKLGHTADAGAEIVAPYDDEPLPVADAGLIATAKTGSDAAIAPALPVADASTVTEPEPEPTVTPEPAPAPAPAPDAGAGVRPYFLDGRTVGVTNLGRRGAARREFSLVLNPQNAQNARVTVYDLAGTELGKGNANQTALGKWSIDAASVDGSYHFQASIFTNDQTETLTGGATVRENGLDWTSATAGLKPR